MKKLNKQTSYLADNQIQITEFILVTFLADQEAEPMTDRIPLEPSILPLNRNLMNFQHCACSIVWNAQVRPLDFTAQWPPGMLRTMNKNVLKRERKKKTVEDAPYRWRLPWRRHSRRQMALAQKKKKKQVGPKRFPFNSKNDCSFRQTKMYSSPVISVKKVTKKVLLQFRVERLRHFPKKLKNR